ncbi:MAG: Rieske 2Fe-2S domain-containing protein, partial [Candidatus Rokuibacteriota bacterium]
MASANASGGPFARGPFDGYARRTTPAPDPELTPVGPGTAGGEYLRRFWQPVAFVRDLGGPPRRVRILGEDLVVFRDGGGHTGVLHLHCAHRGTSLEFGIPLERGLRCCYHGWVYDVDEAHRRRPGGGSRPGSVGDPLAGGQGDSDPHPGPGAASAARREPGG